MTEEVVSGQTTIGTKIYMSKETHQDAKTPPTELVEMSYDASDFGIDRGSVTEHDRTGLGHLDKVVIAGLAEAGSVSTTLFYEGKKDSSYRSTLNAFKDRKPRYFKRVLNNGDTVEFIASVTSFSDGMTIDDLLAVSTTLKVSGGFIDTFADE